MAVFVFRGTLEKAIWPIKWRSTTDPISDKQPFWDGPANTSIIWLRAMIGRMSTLSSRLFFFFCYLWLSFFIFICTVFFFFPFYTFPRFSLRLCQVAVTVMGQPACFHNQFAGICLKYSLLKRRQTWQDHCKDFIVSCHKESWCSWSLGLMQEYNLAYMFFLANFIICNILEHTYISCSF